MDFRGQTKLFIFLLSFPRLGASKRKGEPKAEDGKMWGKKWEKIAAEKKKRTKLFSLKAVMTQNQTDTRKTR